jgi:transcriptional regulator with XRE-family HTH domain
MTHLRVKELAQARGLNIQHLANRAQLSYTTVLNLWHDKADQYNRRSLDRIAVALGVTVADLFGGEPADTREVPGQYAPTWAVAA